MMEQQSVQSVQSGRLAGRTRVRAEVFFYDACFIIHKEDEVSRMSGSMLAGVPLLLHSFTPTHTYSHCH